MHDLLYKDFANISLASAIAVSPSIIIIAKLRDCNIMQSSALEVVMSKINTAPSQYSKIDYNNYHHVATAVLICNITTVVP